jgi:hypothetical protein
MVPTAHMTSLDKARAARAASIENKREASSRGTCTYILLVPRLLVVERGRSGRDPHPRGDPAPHIHPRRRRRRGMRVCAYAIGNQ